MLALRRRITMLYISHSSVPIFTECRYMSSYKNHESSAFMKKLINRGHKTKKKWYQSHVAEPMEIFDFKQQANKRGVTPAQRIRAIQLAHVLYDKITHIMGTGELSEEIFNKHIFITSVKMQAEFTGINVFWDCNRSDAAEVETLLYANSGKLRSLLISYHVLGRIPPVIFVKDKSTGDLTNLNLLFEVADYGPDYEPSNQPKLTQTNMASGSLSRWGNPLDSRSSNAATSDTDYNFENAFLSTDFTKDKSNENSISYNDSNTSQTSTPENLTINLMQGLKLRSNLYGLPHEDLMKKVTAYRTKVKHASNETLSSTGDVTTNFDMKKLSRKDNLKLMSINSSDKLNQQLLERDFNEFMQMSSENDSVDEIENDDYDSDGDYNNYYDDDDNQTKH